MLAYVGRIHNLKDLKDVPDGGRVQGASHGRHDQVQRCSSLIIFIISVLFITLACNLPEWCDQIKLSNLPSTLNPKPYGVIKSDCQIYPKP